MAYHRSGKADMVRPVLDQIPEFYFTKLEWVARLTAGEESLEAAKFQMNLSGNSLVQMLRIMQERYSEMGDTESAACCESLLEGVKALFRELGGNKFELSGYEWIDA
jgi:hypothetical protein